MAYHVYVNMEMDPAFGTAPEPPATAGTGQTVSGTDPTVSGTQTIVTVLIFLLAAALLGLAAWLVLRPADGAGSLAPLPTVSGVGSADG